MNQTIFSPEYIRTTMFRAPRYLEKTEYIQFNLDTPLTFPGNGQHQRKSGQKFFVKDRDNVYDWYNAYFRVNFIPLNRFSFFEELSDRLLPPIHLGFEIVLQDDDEMIFQNDGTGRRIVVRNFELWVPQLTLTSEGQKMFNENFMKPAQSTYLKEVLHPSPSRVDASGSWLISAGVRNPKHVFIFFQQTRKQNSLTHNPYIFDTFDLDGDDSAKLSSCRLQYGTNYLPELEYESDFKLRILNDLVNYRYRKNDYNSGTQLQVANFSSIYPILYFDLRSIKESVTGDPKDLTLHYRLNEAADIDYTVYAAVLNEKEIVVKQIGNDLVLV